MADTATQPQHLTTGQYNPYTGREALDIIMKRIYNQLRNHQDFGTHLAYTKFGFTFQLDFMAESLPPNSMRGKGSAELKPKELTVTVEGTSAQAPDEGRREAGLFVPTPTLTQGGMVDIPLQNQDKP